MKKKLRVWWIPQVGMKGKSFKVDVPDIKTANVVMDVLAKYDIYQFENNIKPDFSNVGGLEVWNEKEQEWEDWMDPETGMSFEEWVTENLENGNGPKTDPATNTEIPNRNEINAFCKGFKEGKKAATSNTEIDIIARLLWAGIISDDVAGKMRSEREQENANLVSSCTHTITELCVDGCRRCLHCRTIISENNE